jgi:hypothetical protein
MFTAGWNQPGYLPESDPEDFEDFDDAKEVILDEIDRTADNAHLVNDKKAIEECNAALDDADGWIGGELGHGDYWQVYCDGYVYWIAREV